MKSIASGSCGTSCLSLKTVDMVVAEDDFEVLAMPLEVKSISWVVAREKVKLGTFGVARLRALIDRIGLPTDISKLNLRSPCQGRP